jgi:hypothetical protein
MEYKEMCRIMHPYTCPACGNHMLFFTRARNNNVIDYKNLMDNMSDNDKMMDYLSEKDVEYLKCIMCKKMYIIDWTKGYARPLLYKDTLIQFGYKFKE